MTGQLAGRRIALVLATSTGGVGAHVRSLIAPLIVAGAEVSVFGPAATEQLFGFTAEGARFAPVEIATGPRPFADAVATVRLRRLTRNSEVVHAHGLRAGLVSVAAQMGCARPVVVTLHNALLASPGMSKRVLDAIERQICRRADIVLGVSGDLVTMARQAGARDVRFAPVAAPALDRPTRGADEVRAELGSTGRPLILVIGRLHEQKGLDVLLPAAVVWGRREPRPLVVIAGDGPLEAALRRQIAALDAPVRLLGRRGDVADLLQAADVVVLPSLWEARSLVAQEAMRAGRPLVTTAVGGLPELVGDAALLVPPGDSVALADAVQRLLDDPALARSLAAAAADRARRWPSEQDMTAQLFAVYAALMGRA